MSADWPAPARALLERARERHGHAAWTETERVVYDALELGGRIPRTKGLGRAFAGFGGATVELRYWETRFHDLPAAGGSLRWRPGAVARLDADGAVAEERSYPRRGMHGMTTAWDALDHAFFFGYALAHYHRMPFDLDAARFLRPARAQGWEGFDLEFPADYPTHCRRQSFYFDASGLLRRHDYVTDVISRLARGAHLHEEHAAVDGLLLPMRRRVYARLGRLRTPMLVLEGRHAGARAVSASA